MRGEANGGGEDRWPRGENQEHDGDDGDEERPQRQAQAQAQRPATRPSSGPQPSPPQNQQHPPPLPGVLRNVGYVGKHRLSTAITRLDQELQSLQMRVHGVSTQKFDSCTRSPRHPTYPTQPYTWAPPSQTYSSWPGAQTQRGPCPPYWHYDPPQGSGWTQAQPQPQAQSGWCALEQGGGAGTSGDGAGTPGDGATS